MPELVSGHSVGYNCLCERSRSVGRFDALTPVPEDIAMPVRSRPLSLTAAVAVAALLPVGCVKFLEQDADLKTTDGKVTTGKPADKKWGDEKKTTAHDSSRVTRANYERIYPG